MSKATLLLGYNNTSYLLEFANKQEAINKKLLEQNLQNSQNLIELKRVTNQSLKALEKENEDLREQLEVSIKDREKIFDLLKESVNKMIVLREDFLKIQHKYIEISKNFKEIKQIQNVLAKQVEKLETKSLTDLQVNHLFSSAEQIIQITNAFEKLTKDYSMLAKRVDILYRV